MGKRGQGIVSSFLDEAEKRRIFNPKQVEEIKSGSLELLEQRM